MKNIVLLFLILGGHLILGCLIPLPVKADQAAEIAELKQMLLDQAAEISALKQEVLEMKQPPAGPIHPVEIEELKQQVAALTENQIAHEDSALEQVAVHASLSQGYLLSDGNDWIADTGDGTFGYNEFAFNISYDITAKLRAGLQLMSRDFGPLMDNKVYLDWAIADYAWQDYLGIRFGRLKTPFGLYNESRDIDGARIAIMLPQGVYPERGRDLLNGLDGGGIYGSIAMGAAGSLSYQAAIGDSEIDKKGGSVRLIESDGLADLGGIENITARNVYSFQLIYDMPLDGLRLVGSYLEGEAKVDGKTQGLPFFYEIPDWHSWVASLEYTWDNLIIAGEFRRERNHLQRYVIPDASIDSTTTDSAEGWFISGSYRFADWFAAEVYYSELYPNTGNKDGAGYVAKGQDDFLAWQKDIALTGRFDINDNWLIKTGVTFSDGLGAGYAADYPIAGIADQNWILYQLKTTVSF